MVDEKKSEEKGRDPRWCHLHQKCSNSVEEKEREMKEKPSVIGEYLIPDVRNIVYSFVLGELPSDFLTEAEKKKLVGTLREILERLISLDEAVIPQDVEDYNYLMGLPEIERAREAHNLGNRKLVKYFNELYAENFKSSKRDEILEGLALEDLDDIPLINRLIKRGVSENAIREVIPRYANVELYLRYPQLHVFGYYVSNIIPEKSIATAVAFGNIPLLQYFRDQNASIFNMLHLVQDRKTLDFILNLPRNKREKFYWGDLVYRALKNANLFLLDYLIEKGVDVAVPLKRIRYKLDPIIIDHLMALGYKIPSFQLK